MINVGLSGKENDLVSGTVEWEPDCWPHEWGYYEPIISAPTERQIMVGVCRAIEAWREIHRSQATWVLFCGHEKIKSFMIDPHVMKKVFGWGVKYLVTQDIFTWVYAPDRAEAQKALEVLGEGWELKEIYPELVFEGIKDLGDIQQVLLETEC